jgi:hypothetical protein
MLVRARLFAFPIALSTLAACFGKDMHNPGTPIGKFHVEGKLTANSCGDSLGAQADWQFDVKLSQDPGVLYWVQGGIPVQGTLDASSHAKMQSQSSQVVHAADAGTPFCAIERGDTLDVTLAQDKASFSATVSYTFNVGDGSVCDDQMASSGGPYATLPCTVTYSLTGTKSAAAN